MADVIHKYAKETSPVGSTTLTDGTTLYPYRYTPLNDADGLAGEIVATLDIGTDNLGVGDEWSFFLLPEDFVITDVSARFSSMDTDGSATLEVRIKAEDGTTTTDISNADDATPQDGGVSIPTNGLPISDHAAKVRVYAEVVAAAATGAAGTATMVVKGYRL